MRSGLSSRPMSGLRKAVSNPLVIVWLNCARPLVLLEASLPRHQYRQQHLIQQRLISNRNHRFQQQPLLAAAATSKAKPAARWKGNDLCTNTTEQSRNTGWAPVWPKQWRQVARRRQRSRTPATALRGETGGATKTAKHHSFSTRKDEHDPHGGRLFPQRKQGKNGRSWSVFFCPFDTAIAVGITHTTLPVSGPALHLSTTTTTQPCVTFRDFQSTPVFALPPFSFS